MERTALVLAALCACAACRPPTMAREPARTPSTSKRVLGQRQATERRDARLRNAMSRALDSPSRPTSGGGATKRPRAAMPLAGCPKPRHRCEPGCPQGIFGGTSIRSQRDARTAKIAKGVNVLPACLASASCYETVWRRISRYKGRVSVAVIVRDPFRGRGSIPFRASRPLHRLRRWLKQRENAGRLPISLGLCAADSRDLVKLAGLPAVGTLDIRQMALRGAELRRLGSPAALSDIAASCSAFDDEAARWAATLPRLTALWLDSTHVTSAGIRALRGKRILRKLSLFATAVDRRIAPTLATLRGLEWLNLSQTPIDASVCHALNGLPLRILLLAWRKKCAKAAPVLDTKCMQTIGGLSQLHWLVFKSWPLRGVDLAALHALKKLRYLDLADTALSHRQLEAISRLPALEVLQLTGNSIDKRSLPLLRRLPKLRRLSVPRDVLREARRLLPRVRVEGRWFFWLEGMKSLLH